MPNGSSMQGRVLPLALELMDDQCQPKFLMRESNDGEKRLSVELLRYFGIRIISVSLLMLFVVACQTSPRNDSDRRAVRRHTHHAKKKKLQSSVHFADGKRPLSGTSDSVINWPSNTQGQKKDIAPMPIEPSGRPTVSMVEEQPSVGKDPMIQAIGEPTTSEHYIYAKVLDSYRSKNIENLERTMHLLVKAFPNSVFADNSIYLAAQLAFETENVSKANFYLAKILHDYPQGNKVPSALLLKGILLRKQNKLTQSIRVFERLQKTYPGSLESARSQIECKLVRSNLAKSQEI